MCGIAGLVSPHLSSHATDVLGADFLATLARRGPDGSGCWIDSRQQILFAHTRLAILDPTSRSDQPMHTTDGRYTMVFNGEIYNYIELRTALEADGYRCKTSGDTEVLLQMFTLYGPAMLKRLRGMFAIAIWDALAGELLLARDPLGIKPLYYAQPSAGSRFVAFASQVKALLRVPGIDLSPDAAGQVGFFLWGSVPEPHTLYRGIRPLAPGSYMLIKPGDEPRVFAFASLLEASAHIDSAEVPKSRAEMLERLHAMLSESVRFHMRSDVPVGIFLSAGLDSGAICSLAMEHAPADIHALTLGFDSLVNTVHDEVPLAKQVAAEWGIDQKIRIIDKSLFLQRRDDILTAMDQPSIDGINSYFVSYLARSFGYKVALSGLGGDEFLGGYPSFTQIPRLVKRLAWANAVPSLGKGFRILTALLIRRFSSPKYAGLFEYGGNFAGAYLLRRALYMPWELPQVMDPDMAREGWRELAAIDRLNAFIRPLDDIKSQATADFLRVSMLEMTQYMRSQLLRDTDWASMAHSVEVRVPLVDFRLMQQLAPLRASLFNPTKRDMVDSLIHKLPDNIVNRAKTGFVVPVRDWMQDDQEQQRGLRSWARFVYNRLAS